MSQASLAGQTLTPSESLACETRRPGHPGIYWLAEMHPVQ